MSQITIAIYVIFVVGGGEILGTFAPRPCGWISRLKKSHDLQICTRPTCRGILCSGICKKNIFQPEIFVLEFTNFYIHRLSLPWVVMAYPDATHLYPVMCVKDDMFTVLIYMPMWCTEIVFSASFTTFNAYLCVFTHFYFSHISME